MPLCPAEGSNRESVASSAEAEEEAPALPSRASSSPRCTETCATWLTGCSDGYRDLLKKERCQIELLSTVTNPTVPLVMAALRHKRYSRVPGVLLQL